jgi:UBX domain-containing protein 1/4
LLPFTLQAVQLSDNTKLKASKIATMAISDLDQLIDMGFEEERAKLAISNSGGRTFSKNFPFLHQNTSYIHSYLTILAYHTVQGALEWLEENQDKSLEEIKASGPTLAREELPPPQADEQAQSLICNDCGKKFRGQAQAEYHASKTQHVDFSESTEEIALLTEEEKKAKLAELREILAAKRTLQSEQDKIDRKRNEVSLCRHGFLSSLLRKTRKFGARTRRRLRIPGRSYKRRSN